MIIIKTLRLLLVSLDVKNKPSVLPREEKRAELPKEGELDAS